MAKRTYDRCRFRPHLGSIKKAFSGISKETWQEIAERHWFELGLQLLPNGSGDDILNKIDNDEKHHKPSLIRVLEAWMEFTEDEDVTWEKLLLAIETLSLRTTDAEELAKEIEKWLLSGGANEGWKIVIRYHSEAIPLNTYGF